MFMNIQCTLLCNSITDTIWLITTFRMDGVKWCMKGGSVYSTFALTWCCTVWDQARHKCCMWSLQSCVSFIYIHKHTQRCVWGCGVQGVCMCVCVPANANSTHMLVGVGMSMSLHACSWVVYSTLSPVFWAHDASSSLAETVCISMKWNLSVPDSWQFRPGQHKARITSRQTDYLYRRLLPALSHDSI